MSTENYVISLISINHYGPESATKIYGPARLGKKNCSEEGLTHLIQKVSSNLD